MEDFTEQYRREVLEQEIKSNKRTIKGFIWTFAAVGLMWILTMTGFFEVDRKLISIAFLATLVMLLPVLCIFVKGNLADARLKYAILSLMCIESGVIASFLSFHAVLIYVLPLLFAIQYRKRSTVWFVYWVNTVTMLISSVVSFYFGLCDLNILLQSNHVRNWYLDLMAEGALNIPFNENPIYVIVVFEVFPRSITLLLFSILIHYTVISSNEDAYRIARLTYLKETDTITKVYNKNKYEEMVTEYYPRIEQVSVTFWDLNNLKEINDEYGHAMGDKAIEMLSASLYAKSDYRHRVYRIGGDEFLMIIDNPVPGETERLVKGIKESLESHNADSEIKTSSAVGVAFGKGKDILEIVKKADACMYENKRLSKAEPGLQR